MCAIGLLTNGTLSITPPIAVTPFGITTPAFVKVTPLVNADPSVVLAVYVPSTSYVFESFTNLLEKSVLVSAIVAVETFGWYSSIFN